MRRFVLRLACLALLPGIAVADSAGLPSVDQLLTSTAPSPAPVVGRLCTITFEARMHGYYGYRFGGGTGKLACDGVPVAQPIAIYVYTIGGANDHWMPFRGEIRGLTLLTYQSQAVIPLRARQKPGTDSHILGLESARAVPSPTVAGLPPEHGTLHIYQLQEGEKESDQRTLLGESFFEAMRESTWILVQDPVRLGP